MKTVWLVWRKQYDGEDTLEGIYPDEESAEYAVDSNWLEFHIQRRLIRTKKRKIKS